MPATIRTLDLTKYYGKVRGVEGLNLEVEEGEVFGFLGPNGAGKTTTIRLLLDLIRPTRGRAELQGLDSRRDSLRIRRQVGYVPGELSLYGELTGRELVGLKRRLWGEDGGNSGEELAERLELDLSRRVRTLSSGNKQKLALVLALLPRPRLLILDEPTLGLDPLKQQEVYRLLREEQAQGKTVFLSSHILPEVERLCDRVGIVREGRLVALERVADLKHKKVRRMEATFSQPVSPDLLRLPGVEVVRAEGNRLELSVLGNPAPLLARLAQLPLEDLVFPEASLEDTFFQFYQEPGR